MALAAACLSDTQASYVSWKVIELKIRIFQPWKIMENGCGHVKSWNSTNRSCNFLTRFKRIIL